TEIDLQAADAGDALDARKLSLALLQYAIGVVALAGDLLQMLAQPFGGDGVRQRIVQGGGRWDALAGALLTQSGRDGYPLERRKGDDVGEVWTADQRRA